MPPSAFLCTTPSDPMAQPSQLDLQDIPLTVRCAGFVTGRVGLLVAVFMLALFGSSQYPAEARDFAGALLSTFPGESIAPNLQRGT